MAFSIAIATTEMMSEISKSIFILIIFTYQYAKVECVQQYSDQFSNKNGYENREELVIGNVTSYDRFELGCNVFKWKSVTIEGKNYAVGLMSDGICIFTAEMDSNNTLIFRNNTDFKYTAVDVDLVKYWDSTTKRYEPIVILVASNTTQLKWCTISDTLQLVHMWNWNLHKKVVHINLFKVNNIYHLLVLKKKSYSIADIYRIKLDHPDAKHFWLSQSLPLKYSSQTSTFTSHGFNSFLAIPQKDMVCVFKYEGDRFIPFLNISSPKIDYINSFSLDLDSYLLINGDNAGMYKFSADNLRKENIEDLNFNGINFWLPLKVKTYKDEIILLGQRILEHEGHKSKRIEVIMKSGDKFYLHDEVPCRYYGDSLSGIDCLVEEENHNHSLKGSTSLIFGRRLGIVVPRRDMASGLFMLHVDTRPTPSPIQKRITELKSLRNELEKLMEQRKQLIEKIQTRLKANHKKVEKPIESKQVLTSGAQSPKYNSSSARLSDSDSLSRYEARANLLQTNLDNIQESLKTAVRRDAESISLENLTLNDIVAIKGSSRIADLKVETISNTTANSLFTDFVRLGDKMPITAEKTFKNLELEQLDVEVINKQDTRNMAFKKESEILKLKGDFVFTNLVEVTGDVTTTSGKINDYIDLSQALTIDDNYEEEIHFENVNVNHLQAKIINKLPIPDQQANNAIEDGQTDIDKIHDDHYIPGNLTVENINGENFQDLLDNIYMRNENIVINGKTIVDGLVDVTGTIDVEYLNGLKFPEDYIFRDKNNTGGYIQITGNKHFETLTTNTLTTSGLINGKDVSTIILRQGNWSIPGSVTFANLTVNGELEVKGNVTGADISSNPTIKDTNILTANLNFDVLEIEGTVTVRNSVNGSRLDQILTDIVYKNEKEVTITSVKDFKGALTIKEDMKVTSNKLNGISLDSFVNKISDQTLNINVLNGDVTINHLFITGLFDGINITQLNEETVKLNGEHFISAELTFSDDVHVDGDFKINGTLNDLTPDSYIFKTGNRILPNLNALENIEVDSLTVDGNFKGKISNFDLDKFNKKRLSLSRDQHVTETYFVKNLEVENLNASKINNYDYRYLTDEDRHRALLLDKILTNQVRILELNIVGNASIGSINGMKMEDILKTCFYRSENTLKSSIAFESAEFNNITIESINDIPFQVFMDNLIFKNETNVTFDAPVFFLDGLEVVKFIETDSINLIPLKNFLRKTGNQEVLGPLVIKGDVIVETDVVIGEDLNDIPVRHLEKTFEVIDDNTYKINDEVVFETYTYINDLFVDGYINGIKWPEFLNRVVRRKDDAVIPEVTHFINQVQIRGDLGIMHGINNNDLSKFVNDIVYIGYDAYIQGLVSFAQPVYIEEEFIIESDLWCDTIMGIDVRDWPKRAVTLDAGKIHERLNFEDVSVNEFIFTNYINNINMSTLIPLRTEQFIPEALYFEEMTVTQGIRVDNLVNNVKLEPEFANTVLNDGDQEISSEIEFTDKVVVYGDLITSNLVNGFDLNKVVTTSTNQNLTAEYIFEGQTFMHSNLNIHGLVNGINILDWEKRALMKEREVVQSIEVPLSVSQNLTFANNLFGNQSIGSLNIDSMANTVQSKKNLKENEEKLIIGGFSNICDNVNYLLHKAKSQIYKFKYFEFFQSINFNNEIGLIHNFQYENIHYMLVNEINSCTSQLFSWSASGYTLIRNDIETGILLQILTVKDKNSSLYFVGRSSGYATCLITGTNIWKFENVQEILHILKLEDMLLLEQSKIPGTFYGSSSEFVHEFNIQSHKNSQLRRLRKWRIDNTDNLAYMPHNLGTGLALRDGRRILKLLKEDNVANLNYDYNLEETAVENVIEELNSFVPGRNDGEFIVLNVGKSRIRTLTAVTQNEDIMIKGKFDSVKIYEDIFNGKVFHKIWTYKPASLTSVEFGTNGETLLAFLENGKLIQIYEYKGIEGFKLLTTIEQEGQKLMSMKLPTFPRNYLKNILAVVNHDKLILMEAIMDGDSIDDDYLQCTLPNL